MRAGVDVVLDGAVDVSATVVAVNEYDAAQGHEPVKITEVIR
jgi:hypothetical protein